MSNFNDKIAEYTGDGIPAYNRKINEIIKKLNWLMGMRSINGKPITESDQGPVLDLSPVNSSQGGAQPWLTDPLGNQAGWSKIKVFDPTGLMFYDVYAWTGALLAQEDAPWLFDPANNQAGWIVCTDDTFWGTGRCPGTTCLNFATPVVNSSSADNHTSPVWISYGPSGGNITPPSACVPRFYFTTSDQNQITGSGPVPSQPVFEITFPANIPAQTLTWDYAITYDGTQVFHISGSSSVDSTMQGGINILLNPAGWQWNPSGLPGFSGQEWVYQFSGPVSTNANPQLLHTFTYSLSGGLDFASPIFFGQNFMTG